MSTGYYDTFDQELAQSMEHDLMDEAPGFDSDWDAVMENPESHFPGDEGYDCEYEVDHAALMESDTNELHGLIENPWTF